MSKRGSEAGKRLAVISPHLDDGVLSCGDLLAANAGAKVITVFAGAPAPGLPLTGWDRSCGFGATEEVMPARWREDDAALEEVAAFARRLGFLDAQYGPSPSVECVAEAVRHAVDATGASRVFAPLGLFHSDHRLASEAALAVSAGDSAREWVIYADALYRSVDELLEERLVELCQRSAKLTPIEVPAVPASERKRRAVACYRSQLAALEACGNSPSGAFAPEQYWELSWAR